MLLVHYTTPLLNAKFQRATVQSFTQSVDSLLPIQRALILPIASSISIHRMSRLRASVYVAPPIPFPLPKGRTGTWSPISSTLIIGKQEALLVDTPITISQNEQLADWIEAELRPEVSTAPSKRLSTLYITHGHFDHWAGMELLRKRFPGLKVLATAGTIQHIKDSLEPKAFQYWNTLFVGQVEKISSFLMSYPLAANSSLKVELRAIEVGHSDTYNTTVLWVPTIKLAVCGDVVYGNVHQMLAAAKTKELREEWLRAVEKIESLGPELVVPGHKEAHEVDWAFHLANTKEYIRQFGSLVEDGSCKNAKELLGAILKVYPTRFSEGALLAGCVAAFPTKAKM